MLQFMYRPGPLFAQLIAKGAFDHSGIFTVCLQPSLGFAPVFIPPAPDVLQFFLD
jgi:hypothetical protein